MSLLLAVGLAVVAVVAVIVVGIIALRGGATAGPSLTGQTVVVHTRHPDDRSIRGVVVGHHRDRFVLRDAVLLISDDARAAIPHLAEVPLDAVSWWQRIEAR